MNFRNRNDNTFSIFLTAFTVVTLWVSSSCAQPVDELIDISDEGFIYSRTGSPFTPVGFNYDRDWDHRLLEDYWEQDWETVKEDFIEMKALGANVVRVMLQFNRFMDGPDLPNTENLSRLVDLVRLAERLGLYLDLTGLGSFRPKDNPQWYTRLTESERWNVQAIFWGAIAEVCADRPGIFAFNLMNEPIVSGENLSPGAWAHPVAIDGLHYIEYINLSPDGRDRTNIAVAWIRKMKEAITSHDKRHLITVGLFPVFDNVDASGFAPKKISNEIDYISVHLYPQTGQVNRALDLLKLYDVGKPIIIEETFPLNCGLKDYRDFLERSRETASGWLTFYWGKTLDELSDSNEPIDKIVRDNIRVFQEVMNK